MSTLTDAEPIELVDVPSTPPFTRSIDPAERRGDRFAALGIGLILLGIYWLTMGGHTSSVDGETYLTGARALANGTTVLTPGPDTDGIIVTVPNKNGDLTTIAPIGTLALLVPGFVAGKVIAYPFPVGSQEEIVRLVALSTNSVLTAVTGALLFFLCRELGARRRSAVLLAIVFGLGTWAWPHGNSDFSEPGTSMFLTAALLLAVRWWRAPTARAAACVGLLAGCTVLTRSSTLLFVPILLLSGLIGADRGPWRTRAHHALAFGIGGVLPGLAFMLNAWIRFGDPLDAGYPPMRYTTPIYEGILGQFVSSGKGIFFYAPVLLASLFAVRQSYLANRRYSLVVAAILLAHLSVYGRFVIWSGENAYGPRYMVPLLPILIAVVAPVIDSGPQWKRSVQILGVVGFLGPALLGSLIYFNAAYNVQQRGVLDNLNIAEPTQGQQFLAWNFQPRSSPLMLHLRSVPDLIDNTIDRLSGEPGGITPIPAPYEERIHWHARAIELDTWWAWWSTKDGPAALYLLALVPISMVVAGVWVARRYWVEHVPEHMDLAPEVA